MVHLIINLDVVVVVAFQEDAASGPPSSLDAEVFADPLHPNKLLEGLNRLRLNSVLCDVILCFGGQEFSCHRHVLASFSPYFEVKTPHFDSPAGMVSSLPQHSCEPITVVMQMNDSIFMNQPSFNM